MASSDASQSQSFKQVQARKYLISKADGSDIDPRAKYFVVRYDAQAEHGAVGRGALELYALLLRQQGQKDLANDLAEDLLVELKKALEGENLD